MYGSIVVSVGYEFTLVPFNMIRKIKLKSSNQMVLFDGTMRTVYIGESYEDSRELDQILDEHKAYKLEDYLIR